jgi:hypothetical protein
MWDRACACGHAELTRRAACCSYEAPGRQGGFDKFALITKDNELGQVECHILNVLKG